jgi:general secretion pathway protein G
MRGHAASGFTLIELLVVMAIIATLITLALPRYFNSVENSRETVLRQNLALTREVLDKYYGDHGKYPERLEDLVSSRYLRSLPSDPFTGDASSWLIIPPDSAEKGGVSDIRSAAPGNARDGSAFKDW